MEMLRSQLQHLQLNNDTPVFFFCVFFFFEKGFYFSEKRI